MVCAGRLWLEDLGSDALAKEQVRLIHAMATALLHPEPLGEEPRVAQFDWPMHGNLQFDLGSEEAARSLEGFLGRQIDEGAVVELICLGDAAAARVAGLTLACARRRLPSTRDILREPQRKRDAWRELQA